MLLSIGQFQTSMMLLRGIHATRERATPIQLAQKVQLAKLLIAELTSPVSCVDYGVARTRYLAEIKLYCPELFSTR